VGRSWQMAALAESCRELQGWGREPRRSLARTPGGVILWAVMAPFLLVVDGVELLLGLVYPASLGSNLIGAPNRCGHDGSVSRVRA
jgi:hypothetical protein